jgi:predicted P-loop ATPase
MWEAAVSDYLIGRPEVRVHQILADALQVPKERMSKAHEMRVGALLRRRNWTKATKRRGGEPTKVWFAPGRAPEEEPEDTGQADLLGE